MLFIIVILIRSLCFAKSEILTEEYVVSAGETLWSISCDNAQGDVRKYIYDLKEINGIDDSMIYEGQVIKIIK